MFSSLNKSSILSQLVQEFEHELSVAVQAARTAMADATNEENRPENEYDTRALEASYVARGQAQRVSSLQEIVYELKNLKIKDFKKTDSVVSTALLEVHSEGEILFFFFLPKGGGFHTTISGIKIQVITPTTPMGQSLLQCKVGDIIYVQIGKKEKEFEIIDLK